MYRPTTMVTRNDRGVSDGFTEFYIYSKQAMSDTHSHHILINYNKLYDSVRIPSSMSNPPPIPLMYRAFEYYLICQK